MSLKEDFVSKLNTYITVFVTIFVIAIGIYFFLSFQTQLNAIEATVNMVKGTDNLGSIPDNLSQLNILFLAEIISFYVAIIALMAALWYTTQNYLVQKRNALIDPLTNIYNRKAAFFDLNRELDKTKRFGNPLSVAMLDIDHFKQYNDTNGHVAGDRLLKRCAKVMKTSIRAYDIVGRYGGEEFILIFPETSVIDAVKVCERIRETIEKIQFYGQKKMPFKKITVSIGVTDISGKKKLKAKTIVDRADKLLYEAKEAGRNQVKSKQQEILDDNLI